MLRFAAARYIPPKMRLSERLRNDDSVEYGQSWWNVLGRIPYAGLALPVVVAVIFADAGPTTLASAFVLAIGIWVWCAVKFHGFARQLQINRRDKTVTLSKHWPWTSTPQRTVVSASMVRDVVFAARYRGPRFKLLYLNLHDGKSIEIDRGEELARMDRLAADVAAALDRPLREFQSDLFGARLSRESNSDLSVNFYDIRNQERRQSDRKLVLVSLLFLVIGVSGIGGMIYHAGSDAITNLSNLIGLLFFLAFVLCGAAGLVNGILSAESLILFELVIHDGSGLILRFRNPASDIREEVWSADQIAAVVKILRSHARKDEYSQIWLRRTDGRWLLLDEDRADWFGTESGGDIKKRSKETSDSLRELAGQLHKRLNVPIERIHRGLVFTRYRQPS